MIDTMNPYDGYEYTIHERVRVLRGEKVGEIGNVVAYYAAASGRQLTVILNFREDGKVIRKAKRHVDVEPASKENRIAHALRILTHGVVALRHDEVAGHEQIAETRDAIAEAFGIDIMEVI